MNGSKLRSFVLAAAAIASLSALVIFLSERQATVVDSFEAAELRLERVTTEIARSIGEITGAAVSRIESIGRLIGMGLVELDEPIEIIDLLVVYLESSPSIKFLRLGSVSGGYLTAERTDGTDRTLVGASVEGETISWFDTSDLLSPIAHTQEYDPRTEPWYLTALDTRGTSWTYGSSGYGERREALLVSAPVVGIGGALIGVVSAGVEIALIGSILDRFVTTEGVWADIIDADGRLIFSPVGSTTEELPDGDQEATRSRGTKTGGITAMQSIPESNPGWNLLVTTGAPRKVDPRAVVIGALIALACLTSVAAASFAASDKKKIDDDSTEASGPDRRVIAPIIDSLTNELSSVLDHSELMGLSPGLSTEQRQEANTTTRAADRGIKLLRELRSSFEIQAPPSFDLQSLVSDLALHLINSLTGGVRLSYSIAHLKPLSPGWETVGDAVTISRAITQLVENSRDALPDGGVISIMVSQSEFTSESQILCDACGSTISGEWNRIDVCDGGVGIAPSRIGSIFKPDYSFDPDETDRLGLAQVAGALKRCGGHINVDSTPGIGSTFSLYLRRAGRNE